MFYFIGFLGGLHHLIQHYPLERWNAYILNVEKVRYYGWHLIRYVFVWLWLLPAYLTLNPFSVHLIYEFQKSTYLYDLIHLMYQQDWMYVVHHLISIGLLLRSQTEWMYPFGIQVLYLMTTTSIPFHMARMSRHLTIRWEKPIDTLFLSIFGYFRVWKYSQLYWNYYDAPYIPMDIKILSMFLYILQWIWFVGLMYRYKQNYLWIKNDACNTIFQSQPKWSILRPFQNCFKRTILGVKSVGIFRSIGCYIPYAVTP